MGSSRDRHPSGWRPGEVDGVAIVRLAAGPPAVTAGSTAVAGGTTVRFVRCPVCTEDDTKVVDSRTADDGTAVRRRRECLACHHRFTTFERCEEQPFVVVKRSGDRVPFDRSKIEQGLASAAKGRPLSDDRIAAVALTIEDQLRTIGASVTSEQVGLAVLERLRDLDQVAYVRFASVYKGFDDPSDFEREIELLTGATGPTLAKETAPKRH